jgi:UDP-glucose 4-epimerase
MLLEHISDWQDAPLWDVAGIEKATKTWFRYLNKGSEMKIND